MRFDGLFGLNKDRYPGQVNWSFYLIQLVAPARADKSKCVYNAVFQN